MLEPRDIAGSAGIIVGANLLGGQRRHHVEVLVPLEQVQGIREQQRSAGVIVVQMGVHDDIDIIRSQALALQRVQHILVAAHSGTACPGFAVVDVVLMYAGVNQDVLFPVLEQISAVHEGHNLIFINARAEDALRRGQSAVKQARNFPVVRFHNSSPFYSLYSVPRGEAGDSPGMFQRRTPSK